MELSAMDRQIRELPTPSDSGFFRENDSSSKAYFFYYVNTEGRIALISKVYRTARSRNKVQQKVETGGYQAEPVSFKDQFGYQIINGGDKAICAGPLFATEAEREAAYQSLPKELLPEQTEPRPEDTTQRFGFRLNFYLAEDTGTWKGRIFHPLTEEKSIFEGVDLNAISEFIHSILNEQHPEGESSILAESRVGTLKMPRKKQEQPPGAPVRSPIVPRPVAPDVPQLPLTIFSEDREIQSSVIGIGTPIRIELVLTQIEMDKPAEQFDVQVFAKSLVNGKSLQLYPRGRASCTPDAILHVPLSTHNLTAGPYRINAQVAVLSSEGAEPFNTQATGMIQVVR